MATFAKVHGDSQAVQNVGTVTLNSNAVIINTGIASPVTAYKIGTACPGMRAGVLSSSYRCDH